MMNDLFTQALISSLTLFPQPKLSVMVQSDRELTQRMELAHRNKFTFEECHHIASRLFASKMKTRKKIHTFLNTLDASGSTTMCYNLSTLVSLMGFKVLVIDCDPHSHLSTLYSINIKDEWASMYNLINSESDIQSTIKSLNNAYGIIPSNIGLSAMDLSIYNKPQSYTTISLIISKLRDMYDFIFIDTHPTFSLFNIEICKASDLIHIVCDLEKNNLKSISQLIKMINSTRLEVSNSRDYNIIPNKYDSKSPKAQQDIALLRQQHDSHVLNTAIGFSKDFITSKQLKKPVPYFKHTKAPVMEDLISAAREIVYLSCAQKNDAEHKLSAA